MILGENIGSVFNEGKEIQRVYSLGKLVWEKKEYSEIPFTVKATRNGVSVALRNLNNAVIKYSINGGEWKEAVGNVSIEGLTIAELNKNDTVSIATTDTINCFIYGNTADVYGNIMSLMYGDYFVNKTFWKFLFQQNRGLFENCDIRHAKNLILPSPTMQPWGCAKMFYNCKKLLSAPELPATKTDDYCYYAMFSGCSSLTKAPTTLPDINTLQPGCYQGMFGGCSSLTKAPTLPAKYLADDCYLGMFSGCFSLTTAPELPSTTLADGCYDNMFKYCNKLNYIKCYAKYNLKYLDSDWTEGVSPTGILVCEEDVAPTLKSTVPDGWNIEYI